MNVLEHTQTYPLKNGSLNLVHVLVIAAATAAFLLWQLTSPSCSEVSRVFKENPPDNCSPLPMSFMYPPFTATNLYVWDLDGCFHELEETMFERTYSNSFIIWSQHHETAFFEVVMTNAEGGQLAWTHRGYYPNAIYSDYEASTTVVCEGYGHEEFKPDNCNYLITGQTEWNTVIGSDQWQRLDDLKQILTGQVAFKLPALEQPEVNASEWVEKTISDWMFDKACNSFREIYRPYMCVQCEAQSLSVVVTALVGAMSTVWGVSAWLFTTLDNRGTADSKVQHQPTPAVALTAAP